MQTQPHSVRWHAQGTLQISFLLQEWKPLASRASGCLHDAYPNQAEQFRSLPLPHRCRERPGSWSRNGVPSRTRSRNHQASERDSNADQTDEHQGPNGTSHTFPARSLIRPIRTPSASCPDCRKWGIPYTLPRHAGSGRPALRSTLPPHRWFYGQILLRILAHRLHTSFRFRLHAYAMWR